MTDHQPSSDETAQTTEAQPNWRRELEARAKRADDLETELAQLKRREVFRDAGLHLGDGMTDYFMKGYEGDLTVEAIQAEATKVGLTGGVSNEPSYDAELAAEQRVASAASDAGPVTEPDLVDLIRQTTNADELRALIEANGGTFSAAE